MKLALSFLKRAGLTGLALTIIFSLPMGQARAESDPDYFTALQKRLIADDFNADLINDIFDSSAITFDIDGISAYFRHRESTLNYDQFLSAKSLRSARNYMETHKEALASAEKEYGVDKSVITAVMLVETRLGTYVGNRSVINTLATMAALTDDDVRERFWRNLPEDVDITREKFEKKADQKSQWAYRELKAFIEYVDSENFNPHDIQGSYAGAMGIAQFMPSNVLLFAEDGNGDGRINLFDHGDAIASIANYLKHYGWKPGLSREAAGDVIYHYNHSKYYVNIVLKIADKLKG
ncbi:MAG: lytic murein transglycosylase [Desulfobacterales bacterium]|nr:lytic murein transglycosylase [Desulfobacterales bacterium]